ncbi:hypothetical protein YC2023_101040 [Brassica napus]
MEIYKDWVVPFVFKPAYTCSYLFSQITIQPVKQSCTDRQAHMYNPGRCEQCVHVDVTRRKPGLLLGLVCQTTYTFVGEEERDHVRDDRNMTSCVS